MVRASYSRRDDARAARAVSEAQVLEYLDKAVAAAKKGDVVHEESLIQDWFQLARQTRGRFGSLGRVYEQRIGELTNEGLLRRSPFLGSVGDFHSWTDRIVTQGTVLSMHPSAKASVETSGTLT